jgi:hypothetical protein
LVGRRVVGGSFPKTTWGQGWAKKKVIRKKFPKKKKLSYKKKSSWEKKEQKKKKILTK